MASLLVLASILIVLVVGVAALVAVYAVLHRETARAERLPPPPADTTEPDA